MKIGIHTITALGIVLVAIGITSAACADEYVRPCKYTKGLKQARRLVDECEIATIYSAHPPCNVQNSCVVIEYAIWGGCSYARKLRLSNPKDYHEPTFCEFYLSKPPPVLPAIPRPHN